MGPRPADTNEQDLFRMELVNLIDSRHELVRLAELIDWGAFSAEWSPQFVSSTGRPALPTRLMAALLYLKHIYALSDEDVVQRWIENPYWQHFSGERYFRHELPCDPSSLVRWRQRISEAGCEWLLAHSIEAAGQAGVIKRRSLEHVVLDTTVQPKAIAHPTDSRLLNRCREQLVQAAQDAGIALRQSYARVGQQAQVMAGRYAHAKQYKRMRREIRKLRTWLGRVMRDVQRKAGAQMSEALLAKLELAKRLHAQKREDKNKLYALHAPEVECLAKGKARTPYEFGVKVSVATTAKEGLVIGMRSMPGNPYDGHTVDSQLEQVEILTGGEPQDCAGGPGVPWRAGGQWRQAAGQSHPQVARIVEEAAQTPPEHRACDRTHEGRWATGQKLAQGCRWRCDACGAVWRGAQPAHDPGAPAGALLRLAGIDRHGCGCGGCTEHAA